MDNTTTDDQVGGNGAVALKCRDTDLDAKGVKQATLQPTNERGGGGTADTGC